MTNYIQNNFAFNIGFLDNNKIFFDSRKNRISVFYMRENTELVYILQKKVEKGIVYFL